MIAPAGTRVADARFVPMPAGSDLDAALRAWVDWVNDDHAALSSVVQAALAHYQFETLHPFNDGNGRIGRLLIVVQLLQRGVMREPLLAVSPWFEARRREYQDSLQQLSETGEWDPWVAFFCEAIRGCRPTTPQARSICYCGSRSAPEPSRVSTGSAASASRSPTA